jgi:hypothetical protein
MIGDKRKDRSMKSGKPCLVSITPKTPPDQSPCIASRIAIYDQLRESTACRIRRFVPGPGPGPFTSSANAFDQFSEPTMS